MALHYVAKLSSEGTASSCLTACNSFFAFTVNQKNIKVWEQSSSIQELFHLVGHHRTITALTFSVINSSTLLCSASSDYVILWNVEKLKESKQNGDVLRGEVIGKSLGDVDCLALHPYKHEVAAAFGKCVHLLSKQDQDNPTVLEGHSARINCAAFCPHYESTLVTAGDDRTFCVWNTAGGTLVYVSSIISPTPFLCLSMDPGSQRFALGSGDGQVKMIDLTDGNDFRLLHQIDVDQRYARQLREQMLEENANHVVEHQPILALAYVESWETQEETGEEDHGDGALFARESTFIKNLHQNSPSLCIMTSQSLLLVNSRSLDVEQEFNFQQPIPGIPSLQTSTISLPVLGNAVLTQHPTDGKVLCLVSGHFENALHLLSTDLKKTSLETADKEDGKLSELLTQLNMISNEVLLPTSPLNKSELVMKLPNSATAGSRGYLSNVKSPPGSLNKKGKIVDKQPITFHNKIKSSGYGSEPPRRAMFQPKTNFSKSQKDQAAKDAKTFCLKEYPMEGPAPTQPQEPLQVAERPTTINSIQFSRDGNFLACCLANNSTQLIKWGAPQGKRHSFPNSDGMARHLSWNMTSSWLLTSGDDKKCQVWSPSEKEPILSFTHLVNNFGSDREGAGVKSGKENPTFAKPIKQARFYYMDKFIILISGNSFYMYKYNIDGAKSDVKRYISRSKYKLVQSFSLAAAQNITAMNCVNSYHSYITLCAGSDKSVEVFDMNRATSVRTISQVHSRPAHQVVINEGSTFSTQPMAAYNLFLTSAVCDSIKLWDLRSCRCVQRYEGHSNRSYPCGAAFSPCGRFISSGSEDKCAYIFDIRAGTFLHKIPGFSDVVTDVAFHPLKPTLLGATANGVLCPFSV